MLSFAKTCVAAAVLTAVGVFTATETARVGGSGGRRTVTMDCGSGAYIVGATASGGRETPLLGFSLVHRVKFTCRSFNGTTPAATTTQTVEAVGDKAVVDDRTQGTGICPSTLAAATSVEVNAGFYVDRLTRLECLTPTQDQTYASLNVGGSGGSRAFMQCPTAQALYKVEARVGDAIDSMKGYCRAFGSMSTVSVPSQITATMSPKPSQSTPTTIPVNSSKIFSFTIANYAASSFLVLIGITAETDLLGGSWANPPEFRVELINPSGVVVANKSFSGTQAGSIYGVTYRIDANGGWKLKVTNLKKSIGTLNVLGYAATIANF